MDFDERVTTSHTSIFDRIDAIAWHFFFVHYVSKSERYIFD